MTVNVAGSNESDVVVTMAQRGSFCSSPLLKPSYLNIPEHIPEHMITYQNIPESLTEMNVNYRDEDIKEKKFRKTADVGMTLFSQSVFKNVLKRTRRKHIYLLQPSNEPRKKKIKCVDSLVHAHNNILIIVKVKKKVVRPRLKNLVKTANILSLKQNVCRDANALRSSLSGLLQSLCSLQRISGASARSCSMSGSIQLFVLLQIPNRFELLRLSTFKNYPNNATSSLLLARDGFVYTGADDMVTCFCCHARKSNWLEQDVVSEVHKIMSPSCPMVTGINSNNIPINPGEKSFEDLLSTLTNKVLHEIPHHSVPNNDLLRGITVDQSKKLFPEDNGFKEIVTQDSQGNAGRSNENMLLSAGKETTKVKKTIASSIQENNSNGEAADSDTFHVHPSLEDISLSEMGACADPPTPGGVKRNRFKNFWDSVKKKFEIKNKDRRNEICKESVRLAKESSPKAQNLKNMNARRYSFTKWPLKDSQRNRNPTVELGKNITVNIHKTCGKKNVVKKGGASSKLTELGTVTDKSICVDLAKKRNRINTFVGCSKMRGWQIENLADAGFYCKDGNSTAMDVRCFFCDWKLSNWEQEEDVWFQHALHSPTCSFVQQIKGHNYVAEVQELANGKEELASAMVSDTTEVPISLLDQSSILCRDPAVIVSMEFQFSQKEVLEGAHSVKTKGQGSRRCLSSNVIERELKEGRTAPSDQCRKRISLTNPAENLDAKLLKMQIKKLQMRTLCKICRGREMELVFLPCGHFFACRECANASVNCKICEKPIQGKLHAHIK